MFQFFKNNRGEIDTDFLQDFIQGLVIAIIIAITVGACGWGLKACVDEDNRLRNEIVTQRAEVVAIDLQSDTEGSFVWGTGSIGTERYYVVYQILEDNGKQLLKLPADITIIYNTLSVTDTAYVEADVNGYGTAIEYRLYVPVNSIMKEYDLSL